MVSQISLSTSRIWSSRRVATPDGRERLAWRVRFSALRRLMETGKPARAQYIFLIIKINSSAIFAVVYAKRNAFFIIWKVNLYCGLLFVSYVILIAVKSNIPVKRIWNQAWASLSRSPSAFSRLAVNLRSLMLTIWCITCINKHGCCASQYTVESTLYKQPETPVAWQQ